MIFVLQREKKSILVLFKNMQPKNHYVFMLFGTVLWNKLLLQSPTSSLSLGEWAPGVGTQGMVRKVNQDKDSKTDKNDQKASRTTDDDPISPATDCYGC